VRIEEEYKKTGYFWLPGDEEKKYREYFQSVMAGKLS
jgi:hypothetical protein